ncbi:MULTISPECIES: (deoxy)nucleoside triphosphate pyrophosphohydrolase [Psychroserpens]|uniref:8-oxo-dGTP diphosphatase n=1 Tax=Psychroserpens algicola TaxID=1719034 RepID=A0ABT0H9L0_9FLAO|nr:MULTISPECIES: (deoxy)nucleoside triphosphate pyrophosphohydrolase [Psychroserpens]MCK8481046.1 (deoxy)nucleoside triphosphate pyrophosphohydrolase [Psychroserpens algicola]MDG5490766.1 (deoxy)nucleoside triphosphate pyrophosphohydrolase [Psychroserpens sp. SPM9]
MKKIEVVAAIIYFGNEILCVQRPKNKLSYISEKFEFPGGKIEKGETKEEALKRELIEELNFIPTKIEDLFLTVVHKYPDFELTMHSFVCYAETKDINLNEHISCEWLTLNDLIKLDWAEADIPIVNRLVQNGQKV